MDFADRLDRARKATGAAGLDALLITPGPDLRYLTGYPAVVLERLTCLVLPADGDPVLVVPRLERPAALASPAGGLGLRLLPWDETDDPYSLVTGQLRDPGRVAVDDHMRAATVLALRDALPGTEQTLAGAVLGPLRARKAPDEVAALRRAGEAIDRVHTRMSEWLRPGRTEREVGREVAEAIIAEGHERVDFVIVGSGPNGASPHHGLSDRVIEAGDPVVVDIGGTTADGYCSDSTRTYVAGAEPAADFAAYYAVLEEAQRAAVAAVRPGVAAQAVDAAARDVISAAGYGDAFVHRTGHGIGLEPHEQPYIVAGNTQPLEPGMAFSVEPGIYLAGRHGARIEDIVAVTADGVERLNRTPRGLVAL
ncbi:MAG TPA: Xaa-Pro peptidase family protein [Mycobacteriales bacterium]|nr:Xaa-Pro peptidase family protein [Mycobacteriales bacterium]